ncbi:hypothetical protein [Delftia sp. PS-11]|uniref:hypothetical protein n=1 Tax=Delftia sp. PS-11 TaxID=2767222 RepID=UPI003AB52548
MQRTIQQLFSKYLRWVFFLVIAASLAFAIREGMTPEFDGVSISPRKVYRLEYYKASPLQKLWHHNMKMPSFVRLYRIEPEALLGESEVVDMWLNGKLDWYLEPPLNSVWVGNDIFFENIPPECTDCPPLTYR